MIQKTITDLKSEKDAYQKWVTELNEENEKNKSQFKWICQGIIDCKWKHLSEESNFSKEDLIDDLENVVILNTSP